MDPVAATLVRSACGLAPWRLVSWKSVPERPPVRLPVIGWLKSKSSRIEAYGGFEAESLTASALLVLALVWEPVRPATLWIERRVLGFPVVESAELGVLAAVAAVELASVMSAAELVVPKTPAVGSLAAAMPALALPVVVPTLLAALAALAASLALALLAAPMAVPAAVPAERFRAERVGISCRAARRAAIRVAGADVLLSFVVSLSAFVSFLSDNVGAISGAWVCDD